MPRSGKGTAETQNARRKNTAHADSVGRKDALIDIAEMLNRVALESCARHHRYAELVKRGAPEADQRLALNAVRDCDEILDEAVDLYEIACLEETNHADDAWWHGANKVWRAAKEYMRHHAAPRHLARFGNGHSRDDLRDLTIGYELEASSLLRLRHATDSYLAARTGIS
ncbi:MAG TPA: hypothetical protein VII02_12270 [Gemmatimonadaceae bacterium]